MNGVVIAGILIVLRLKHGVNAPKEVSVHREEIYQRIQAEKSQQSSY